MRHRTRPGLDASVRFLGLSLVAVEVDVRQSCAGSLSKCSLALGRLEEHARIPFKSISETIAATNYIVASDVHPVKSLSIDLVAFLADNFVDEPFVEDKHVTRRNFDQRLGEL